MFSAYLVFARKQIHVADGPHGAHRGEEILLLDSFLPSPSSSSDNVESLSLDERLRKEGLPKASVIGEFCFPRKRSPDDASSLVPPSLYFCFTLTQPNGDRVHGFSLRCHRPSLERSNRLDVGSDLIECSVFLTRRYFPRMFPCALQICRVRRYLDRQSCFDFLHQLHGAAVQPGDRVNVESASLNIASKYEFSTVGNSPALAEALFDTTTSQMLHFILGAILLERRVLFVAKNEQKLSDTMYAFDSLLVQMNAPITLGYPHNFVPVLPGSMLEQGAGNPTPYMVGMLKVYLKAMDTLKDLGDMVIVDLDNKQIRLSPGSASLVALGIDQERKPTPQAGEEVNPWLDVTTPFCRDVAQAYAQRDADLLTCTVKALLLHLAGPVKLEDPALRAFHAQFCTTSIYKVHAANLQVNTMLTHMLQANRGFVALRVAYSQSNANVFAAERQAVNNVKQFVLELTSAASKEHVNIVNKVTTEVAKRTFDTSACKDGVLVAQQQRYLDSAPRNWKQVYKSLGLAKFLVRTGSELCVANLWDELKQVFDFTRYSTQGIVGVSSKVAEFVQKRAQDLYSLVVDMHALAVARSMDGHLMVQRSIKLKMQASAKRLSGAYRADLKGFLELTCPDAMLLEGGNESNEVVVVFSQQQPHQEEPEPLLDLDFGDFTAAAPPLPSNKPVSAHYPPPPPPPPPPATIQSEPLLDLYDSSSSSPPQQTNNKPMEEQQQQPPRVRRPHSNHEESAVQASTVGGLPRPVRPPPPQFIPSATSPTSNNSSNPFDSPQAAQPKRPSRGPPPPGVTRKSSQ